MCWSETLNLIFVWMFFYLCLNVCTVFVTFTVYFVFLFLLPSGVINDWLIFFINRINRKLPQLNNGVQTVKHCWTCNFYIRHNVINQKKTKFSNQQRTFHNKKQLFLYVLYWNLVECRCPRITWMKTFLDDQLISHWLKQQAVSRR